MKQLRVFIRKEFLHILRDRRTILVLLGMPVIQIVLFGFAITTELHQAEVAVLASPNDETARSIVQKIDASEYFHISARLTDASQIDAAFREDKIQAVIAFEDHFNENLVHTGRADVQVIADATNPNTATMLSGYAVSLIASYQQELAQQSGRPPVVGIHTNLLYNPQMKSAYNFVPGVMGLILMLICAMMTSIAIVREKESGTMEVLLVSPLRPSYVIISKAVPYAVLSCVNLTSIILLSVYVLGVPVAGSLWSLLAVSLLFIVVALLLGLLVSTLTRTQVTAMLVSGMVFMIPTMLLSGLIFPIESMPRVLQWVSNIVPPRWYISAVRKLMIEGLPLSSAATEVCVLLGMTAVLAFFSVRKFKDRLE